MVGKAGWGFRENRNHQWMKECSMSHLLFEEYLQIYIVWWKCFFRIINRKNLLLKMLGYFNPVLGQKGKIG